MRVSPFRRAMEYLFLAAISALFILPIALLLFQAIGENPSLENFRHVVTKGRNARAFAMGLEISAGASLIAVASALGAALALSRAAGAVPKAILSVILILSGLPFCTLVIPLYFVLFQARLLDSVPVTVLFLAAANVPAGIGIVKQGIDAVPSEVRETALMDGSASASYFARILFPQLVPILAGSLIATFINCWGNFIVPFILLSSSQKMPAALAFFQSYSVGDPSLFGYLSAYAILYYLPVVALYCALRMGMTRIFLIRRIRA